jgi:HTH-type transcriptional regulator/antitoxin HigA
MRILTENETQYNRALSKVEELLRSTDEKTPAEDPTMIELKLLSDLVADYSDEHYSIGV